jgi:hypothetical protein
MRRDLDEHWYSRVFYRARFCRPTPGPVFEILKVYLKTGRYFRFSLCVWEPNQRHH